MAFWLRIKNLYSVHIYKNNLITFLGGFLIVGIGTSTLIGWYTHTSVLFQIQPNLTPMYFNTALCLVLLGIGMLLLLTRYKKLVIIPATAVIIIAGLTLLEYVFGINIGISQFFFKTYMSFHTSSPGRMSPHSALSSALCGTAILLLSLGSSRFLYCIVVVMTLFVLALASISLLGYAANLPATYQWAKLTPMAVHTAISFLIASSGIIFYVYVKYISGETNLSSMLAYFAALFVLCITALLWHASLQEMTETLQELTNKEAERIKENIREKITAITSDMHELSFQWQIFSPGSEINWERSFEEYKKNKPIYKSIEWVDSSFHIQEATPIDGYGAILSLTSHDLPFMYETLEDSKKDKQIKISRVINFVPKGQGFLVSTPLLKGASLKGFILAMIDVDLLLKNTLNKNPKPGFEVALFETFPPKKIFFQLGIPYVQQVNSKEEVRVFNLRWVVRAWPSVEFYSHHVYSFLSNLILTIGIFMAFLLFGVIRSRQTLKDRSLRLQKTKESLEFQLVESSRYAKELRYLKEMTENLQTCTSLGKAAIPVIKFCKLFFPSTDGIIYLLDKHNENLSPFAHWGTKNSKLFPFSKNKCLAFDKGNFLHISMGPHNGCAHIQRLSSKNVNESFLCIPLHDQRGPFGLLYIHDNKISSKPKSEQKKKLLLVETFARQLSLSFSDLKLRDLLSYQATRDPLTALYNRRYLNESLQREIPRAQRQGHPIALLMIDIDHFKNINDVYGHDAGDEVLKQIGTLLKEYSRKSDIACRFGGEEFVLILPETTLKSALERAEKLKHAVTKLNLIFEGQEIKNLSVSLGVGIYPQNGLSYKELINSIDQALYEAKSLGRNRVEIAKKATILKDVSDFS